MDTLILAALIGAAATFFTGIIAIAVAIWQLKETQVNIIRDSYSKLLEEERILMLTSYDEPSIRKWILHKIGFGNIPEDKEKLYFMTLLQIDHYQHVFYRYKRGLFPEELWPSSRFSMIGSFNTELIKEIWKTNYPSVVSKEFKDYVDASFPDVKPGKFRF